MYKTGHMGTNALIYSPVLFVLVLLDYTAVGVIGLLVTSQMASIPDIDLRSNIFKHRGFTHTFTFAVVTGIIFSIITIPILILCSYIGVFDLTYKTAAAALIGSNILGFMTIVNHILADAITPAGIRPFQKPPMFPDLSIFSNKRYTFDIVYAKNKMANSALLMAGSLCNMAAIYVGTII